VVAGQMSKISQKIPFVLIILIICSSIGLRIYKAHSSGLISDEIQTFEEFSTSIHTALTKYTATNNHLLNSVLIHCAGKIASEYEHYMRIPALLFGALFCVFAAVVVHILIRSSILKIVLLMVILFNWFLFDLTYLARGYAIAMACTFASIALLLHHVKHADSSIQKSWQVPGILILMNFLTLGSMLSALSVVLSINAAYCIIMLLHTLKCEKREWIQTGFKIIFLGVGSFLLLFLLYFRVFDQIRDETSSVDSFYKIEPYLVYFKKVLWQTFHYYDPGNLTFNKVIFTILLILTGLCMIVSSVKLILNFKQFKANWISFVNPISMLIFFTVSVLLLMLIQCKVFNKALGMPRNNVFIMPLVILNAGIFMDQTITFFSSLKIVRLAVTGLCAVFLGILCYLNFPSLSAVDIRPFDWTKQSAVGPLVRRLRQIDPQETWHLNIDGYADCLGRGIGYYQKFGYKVKRAEKGNGDVFVVREHPAIPHTIYLDYDYFLDFHCCVIINPTAFRDKPIIYQVSPAPKEMK
jgi:hypothetical protein